MRRFLIAAGLLALLGGCGDPHADPVGTAASSPRSAAPAEGRALSEDFIVSTNEPFLQARVDGDVLLLTGVDVGERRLAIERSGIDGDARTVVARDATGSVQARVRVVPCQDSMSGAMYPFEGELRVDGGGPHGGCARPASMPAPGEMGEEEARASGLRGVGAEPA